jgi:hypothetical protein
VEVAAGETSALPDAERVAGVEDGDTELEAAVEGLALPFDASAEPARRESRMRSAYDPRALNTEVDEWPPFGGEVVMMSRRLWSGDGLGRCSNGGRGRDDAEGGDWTASMAKAWLEGDSGDESARK